MGRTTVTCGGGGAPVSCCLPRQPSAAVTDRTNRPNLNAARTSVVGMGRWLRERRVGMDRYHGAYQDTAPDARHLPRLVSGERAAYNHTQTARPIRLLLPERTGSSPCADPLPSLHLSCHS